MSDKVLSMLSGIIAFSINKETAEEIERFMRESEWRDIADIPQFRRDIYVSADKRSGEREYLIKLLPKHWLYVYYWFDVPERSFSGKWVRNEEAEKMLSEGKWERCHWVLDNALSIAFCGCTGNVKRLSPPQ